MKMENGVKDEHNEKLRENDVELEQAKIIVAEAETCNEMVKKEDHNKAKERKTIRK